MVSSGSNFLSSLLRGSDPVVSSRFMFLTDGLRMGSFNQVTGLGASIEPAQITEGGQNEFVHQRPSGIKWNNIVLHRGVTDSEAMYRWFKKSSGESFSGNGNQIEFSTCVILALEPDGSISREWEVYEAFPVRWTGPSLNADSSDVAIEELEIAHHGLRTSSFI